MPVKLTIKLNGQPKSFERELTLTELLAELSVEPRRVVVEHNLTIVPKEKLAETRVKDGDGPRKVNNRLHR